MMGRTSDVGKVNETQKDSFELLQRLRALPGSPAPVTAMSGVGSEVEVAEIASAGFAAHLMKPVQAGLIGAYIQTLGRGTKTG